MKNKEISKKIYNQRVINKINNKIKLLGISSKLTTEKFLIIRLITTIIIFLFILINYKYGYILSIIVSIIYYFLLEKIVLDSKIKKRRKKLDIEAIYFFEVLTLSLQTGRNLSEAILVTTSSIEDELSLEFKETLRETKYGKSLTESLTDMQNRIPSDSINNIILALTQANIYGSSIISTMYNQVDYLREKRKMEVKATISKIPTKISIISVFFFIPLILLIIFIAIYRKTLLKNGKEYFQNFSENFKQSFKYWLVGFAIMAISNIIITFVLKQTIAGNEELVRSYIDTSPLLMIFSTVIYAPICEELTFRKSIKDAINNKYIYILTSGLLFGFLHIVSYINTPLDLVYLIPYASLGIVFATLYYKTNNIFSTITIHAMHNALSVLVYLSLGGLS